MTTISIRSEDDSNVTQESIDTTPTSKSEENNKTWYDTNEEYDSWHNAMVPWITTKNRLTHL